MGDRTRLERTLVRVAAMDGCAWVVFAAAGRFLDRAEALVALGPGLVVPLGVALALRSGEVGPPRPLTRLAANAVALGAPCGLGCFVVGGPLASALALAWLVATVLVALEGARRILRRGVTPLAELAIDVGHLYLPTGAIWLAASRANVPLLGFTHDIVLFTAAHFHFAGFGAPVVAGLVGRATTGRVYAASTIIVLLGIPLVAAGIQLSRAFEMPSAIVLALGMLGLAAMLARTALGWLRGEPPRRLAGALLAIAPASLLASMALAVAFTTTGSATRGAGESLIPYSRMAELHGAANAIGFALVALVAFTLSPPAPRGLRTIGSWPRFRVPGFIGPDLFERRGAVDGARSVAGQLDDLDAFRGPGFDPARVHPAVRGFYEQTGAWTMDVIPTWHAPFALPARVFVAFARRFFGQLELPVARGGASETVTTRTFALKEGFDGREAARAYVRSIGTRALFVASYAIHRGPTHTYLSPAFPLPLGMVFVAVLRFDDGAREGSLVVTSRPRAGEGPGDEGLYLLVPLLGPIRLPLDEAITVWPEDANDRASAVHDMRLFGLRIFTFDYGLRRIDAR